MLDKKYDHLNVEKEKYTNWLNKDYFKSGDLNKEPYCIVIPPPNVTGKLHLGHAWDTTLQDIIIRYKRMQGYDCLWLPGMDHAAIATEVKVVNKLKQEGIDKYELGREKFLEKAWEWKEEYALNIREQWAKLGLSLDYSKERFTLDDGMEKAVFKVFIDFYNKGFIYRGERIINWDPVSKTALSNEEVIYKDVPGAFYHLKYMIEDSNDYLEVATTRPETLFGDTAVAVNPSDLRYKELIGKNVILPIVNKLIPIIGDEHADPEFGTGIVKITPAHDPNDFEVGNRHSLERINVMNPDATMNENALQYCGMDRFKCREALLKDLEKLGLLIEIEPITHSVGFSERTDVMVEPYLSKQWFVKMDELAKHTLDNQNNKDAKVNFVPERFEKILNHWMEDCHDWCISRQLWWGHRIPAWYNGNNIKVQIESPGKGWTQDNDVLDTWFSSALWPFATLGWPDNTDLLKRYYPNNCLVTGYDIIFFWVCRMVFQGLEFTNERPFKDCLIHGLIRDKEGRKMSKSLGNGVDPMDIIEKYGCDSLRYFLATSTAAGTDLRYDEDKVAATWNFINKIWNASRFVLMNMDDFREENYNFSNLTNIDLWLMTKQNELISNVTKHMESYDFNVVGSELYNFIWNDFCDNYIELAKFNQNDTTKSVLLYTLTNILKMLHPFMPFVTEEIYSMLPIKDSESIMNSNYPVVNGVFDNKSAFKEVEDMLTFITKFRNKRQELNLKEYDVVSVKGNDLINKILKLEEHLVVASEFSTNVKIISDYFEMIIFYDNSSNNEELKELLNKELTTLEMSIKRRELLLSNENYVSKAPITIVEKEKNDLTSEKVRLEKVFEQLKKIN